MFVYGLGKFIIWHIISCYAFIIRDHFWSVERDLLFTTKCQSFTVRRLQYQSVFNSLARFSNPVREDQQLHLEGELNTCLTMTTH